MRILSEIHRKYVSESLRLLQVRFNFSQLVKICKHECTCAGSLTPICRKVKLDITVYAILRLWPYLSTSYKSKNAKLRAFLHLENRKKIDCFNVDGNFDHYKTVFEALDCYYQFRSCQEACPSLTDQDNDRGNKKRGLQDM